jgi:outer membrane protein assembly factor BamB
VAHGQIWMTTALDEGHSLHALCVDFATGKILHDTEVFHNEVVPEKHARNSYASPTPVIGEDRVFVHFGSMGTAALDLKSGAKLWENRDLKVDFQNGAGGSPLLYKNRLLIACDGMDFQYEVALDVETGRIAWKTERSAIPKLQNRPVDMRKAYPTPVLISREGRDETLAIAAERLYAYDPMTGVELWYVDIPGFSNVPLPAWNEHFLVLSTGFTKPQLWGLRLDGAHGDATASNVAWKLAAGAPAQSSPLLVGSRVYMVSDSGIASCVDVADGHLLWKQRIGSDFSASPVFVEGRIYFCDTAGTTTVIAPADTYTELARNHLDSGFMASPAIVGKSFILRTKKDLYRIEE